MKIDDIQNKGLMTRCIHGGAGIDPGTKAVKRPLVMSNSSAKK